MAVYDSIGSILAPFYKSVAPWGAQFSLQALGC